MDGISSTYRLRVSLLVSSKSTSKYKTSTLAWKICELIRSTVTLKTCLYRSPPSISDLYFILFVYVATFKRKLNHELKNQNVNSIAITNANYLIKASQYRGSFILRTFNRLKFEQSGNKLAYKYQTVEAMIGVNIAADMYFQCS